MAADIVEISPTAADGARKAVFIMDMFTRFVVVVPIADERVITVARALLDRWILLFWPPEKLVSDNGTNFRSAVISELCKAVETKKIFTTPWHPQCDGAVERFNRTLCQDLSKYVLRDADWSSHVMIAAFRYNISRHEATGCTPYKAMFAAEFSESDAGLGLALRNEAVHGRDGQSVRLAAIHASLLRNGTVSRDRAARLYYRAVREATFAEGDTVLVFNPPGLTEVGRKLNVPWLDRTLSSLSCLTWALSCAESSVTR